MNNAQTLRTFLKEQTREGTLWQPLTDGRIECFACGHRCRIGDGKEGICRIRFNEEGRLRVPWGYVAGLHLDPVEKKPFYHALPGSSAMSFGMLGCDYHCAYCQNWITSQTLRDPEAVSQIELCTPRDLVDAAIRRGAAIMTTTYNEPLITSEWAVEVFKLARDARLVTSYVSNGNGTPEVIEYIRPWVDLYKIDLKGFNDRRYRSLGGVLANVLDTIERVHRSGMWLEIVTLVVPGFNDSASELRDIAQFIRGVSPDIPWHVTAFHPDYKMNEGEATDGACLIRAAEIGSEAGLRYVYAGNLPGMVRNYEHTYCPSCSSILIERMGFRVLANRMENGSCPKCHTGIPGFWSKQEAGVETRR